MKTNNYKIGRKLEIPQTSFFLEYVQPDHLVALSMSRFLILCDEIRPEMSWIQEQIPAYLELDDSDVASISNSFFCAKYYIIAGCCLALGFKFAGTFNQNAFDALKEQTEDLWKLSKGSFGNSKSKSLAIKTCLLLSAISLSMVMSGTGNLDVFRILRAIRISPSILSEVSLILFDILFKLLLS
jgi:anaphase-promoting complex subunit 1